jgi:hypothetical protein
VRRWAAHEPLLAGFDCPAALVHRCERRKDSAAVNAVLAAVLRRAAEERLAAASPTLM